MALGAFVPLLFDPSAPTVTPPPFCVSVTVAPLFAETAVAAPLFAVASTGPAPLYNVALIGRASLFDVAVDAGEC